MDGDVSVSVDVEIIVEQWREKYSKLFEGVPEHIDIDEMSEREIIATIKRTIREMEHYKRKYDGCKRNPLKLPFFLIEKALFPEINELYELCKYKHLLVRELEKIRMQKKENGDLRKITVNKIMREFRDIEPL